MRWKLEAPAPSAAQAVLGVLAVIFAIVLTLPAFAQLPVSQSGNNQPGAITDETPTRWFVELSTPPTADGGSAATILSEQKAFRAAARSMGLQYTERYSYKDLFNGFSVLVAPGNLSKLQRIPGVQRIYPVRTIPMPESVADTPDQQDWLSMTGADVAQNELGLHGDGVTVAVMDTGVDYNHPDLGGCFGPNCRVTMGYDFVGDAFNNSTVTTTTPDNDPMDCNGHGTHVSGIIGADGHGLAGHVTGVAPHVTFHAYRVFGCTGSTTDDIMLQAMEMILADGANVLNMSIGSAYDDWRESPTAAGSDRLVKKGIVVVASAGNSGSAGGTYATGSPSTGAKVISVASFENLSVKLQSFTVNGTGYGYIPAVGAPTPPTSGSFTMAKTGTPTTANDGCNPLGAGFTGKVVLIRRGTCSFYIKASNAQSAGAAAVVLYNNTTGFISPTVAGTPPITIPVVAITATDGATLNALIAAGPTTMTWTDQLVDVPNPTAGLVSTFSSFGPTAELDFKPDVGAPGGNIYSTWPLALGGYATLSGTSMASPHVAGSVALLLEARPNTPPALARDVLQNNAVPANWNGSPSSGFLDNVHVQGAGLIHIDRTILDMVSVAPGKIAVGDATSGPLTRTLTFTNKGTVAATYTMSHVAALTTGPTEFTIGEFLAPATVAFSAPTVTVPAGGTATVNVTITAPAVPSLFTYGGYIVATPPDSGLQLRVPYMGVSGNYQDVAVLGLRNLGLPWLTRGDLNPLGDGAVFTMADANNIPYFVFQLAHSARILRVNIYSAASGGGLGKSWQRAFQFEYLGRNSTSTGIFSVGFDGQTSNGSTITVLPNGNYIAVMTVLKPLGDPTNPADVETWNSPMFTIARP